MTDAASIVEQKRAEAAGLKGVWYDPRARKFAAEVYSQGARHFLGLFETSAEAAAAYATARAELPTGAGGPTFVDAFTSFLADCRKDADGRPQAGEVLIYREQPFTFDGIDFRTMGRKRRPFFRWQADCIDCGAPYETLTATSPDGAKGITRTCEEHRKGGKPKAAATQERRRLDGVDERIVRVSAEAAANLSLVYESVSLTVFRDECRRLWADIPNAKRYWIEDERSPVVVTVTPGDLICTFK